MEAAKSKFWDPQQCRKQCPKLSHPSLDHDLIYILTGISIETTLVYFELFYIKYFNDVDVSSSNPDRCHPKRSWVTKRTFSFTWRRTLQNGWTISHECSCAARERFYVAPRVIFALSNHVWVNNRTRNRMYTNSKSLSKIRSLSSMRRFRVPSITLHLIWFVPPLVSVMCQLFWAEELSCFSDKKCKRRKAIYFMTKYWLMKN